MVLSRRWGLLALVLGTAFVYSQYPRRERGRLWENVRRYSAPTSRVYDAVAAPILGGFYRRVATELAEIAPQARFLEVDSGPD
jgi:hypothetical protein